MNYTTSRGFFTGLLLLVIVLAILIFLPFLSPLVFAVSLAVIFTPVYKFFLRLLFPKSEKSTIAALITLVLVAVIVIVPGFFIVTKMYAEIQDMYYFLTEEGGRSSVISSLNSLSDTFSNMVFNVYPSTSFESLNITEYMQQGLEWAFGHVDTLFTVSVRSP
jgi:predicted PurR-regulated permease PerM